MAHRGFALTLTSLGVSAALACACTADDPQGLFDGDAGAPDSAVDGAGSAPDAGAEAGAETGPDAATDARADAPGDAGIDSGADAGADAEADTGSDAGADAGCPDLDGDGYAAASCGGTDCDDTNPGVHPGVVEADDWVVDTVTTRAQTTFDAEIALDASGAPRIVYFVGPNVGPATMYYATLQNGAWVSEAVSALALRNPRLVIDASGAAHVAYYQGTTADAGFNGGDLHYATNASGSWVDTLVSTDRDVRYQPSLVVDGAGTVYVSHVALPGGVVATEVLLSTRPAGGTFSTETVASDAISSMYNALWLSGSTLHVFHQSELTNIADATRQGSAWQDQTIFTGTGGQNWPGISVGVTTDAQSRPHLVHFDLDMGALRHTYASAGGWQTETMDPAGVAAQKNTSLAISNGYLYATYPQSALVYVTNRTGTFTRWKVIDDVEATIRCHGRIVAAPDGSLHVAVETHNATFTSFAVVHVHRPATDGVDQGCNGE